MGLAGLAAYSQPAFAQTTSIRVFDAVLFYGGYSDTSVFLEPAPAGVVRLKTSLFTKKLTETQLGQIGNTLNMKVLAKPACDNYDRAGHVSLAFVPKGNSTYSTSDTAVKRIEIARFITPFMDKNKTPDTVGYNYEINNVASILKEKAITDNYDIWMELEIFGTSGAANTEISGCANRKDVWYGTLDLYTDASAPRENNNIILPLANQTKFNNYQTGASDTIGETVKTISFTLPSISYNTKVYLITSNHGANSGGEEYNRRNHFVYIDGVQELQYKPGFTSCEPYRIYNTQRNGIYNPATSTYPQGVNYLTDAQWQSFSNWCPGAYIPTRVIDLGTMQAGTHTFKISVPDAQFVGGQGNFPMSVMVQGKTEPVVGINNVEANAANTSIYPNPATDDIIVRSDNKIEQITMYNVLGQKVGQGNSKTIDVSRLTYGVYYVKIRFENNISVTKSFVKK